MKLDRIIGLSPPPWNAEEVLNWPTYGYDGSVTDGLYFDPDNDDKPPLERSGYTLEEWQTLADEMIRRWTDWKAFVATLK